MRQNGFFVEQLSFEDALKGIISTSKGIQNQCSIYFRNIDNLIKDKDTMVDLETALGLGMNMLESQLSKAYEALVIIGNYISEIKEEKGITDEEFTNGEQ